MKRLCGFLFAGVVAVVSPTFAATTITVTFVNNPDMLILKDLTPVFTAAHPDINVEFQILPEDILLTTMTEDAATHGGRYDIVNVGSFEVQGSWVRNKWLAPLDPLFAAMSPAERADYDLDDVIKPLRDALTVDGKLYALPVYGESKFTMYRKDLFEKAGLTMPEQPTWSQIREFACKLNDPAHGVYGIAMKGIADYAQLGPLLSTIHSFGVGWFDENWHPQFTSPGFKKAFTFYIDLLKDCGEPGASSVGFNEALTLMSQGRAAIWADATVAAGALEDSKTSKVAGKIGYALAPEEGSKNGAAWVWSSALGIAANSKHKDDAFKFITWASSKKYRDLVAQRYGVIRTPPGTRYSTYKNPAYLAAAAPFAEITLEAIVGGDIKHPTNHPVPYTGTSQIDIPEYAKFASDFAQDFSAVVAGTMSIDEALSRAQSETEKVMEDAGYIKK